MTVGTVTIKERMHTTIQCANRTSNLAVCMNILSMLTSLKGAITYLLCDKLMKRCGMPMVALAQDMARPRSGAS
jgi:hypothetical protein